MNTKSIIRKWSLCFFLFSLFVLPGFVISPAGADILVISSHPDDDVIMASGVIFRALQDGSSVRVVYVTNGDFASIPTGYTRQGEAVAAQSALGMAENDLIFLGYPDGGLNTIYASYPRVSDRYVSPHGQSITYGNRGLGRTDYHSYRFGAPALYNGANIISDLRTIISEFQPEHIFTISEYDTTADHATTYRFVRAALDQLALENPAYQPTIHKTIVWSANISDWPNEYDPTAFFANTINLGGTPLLWGDRESLDVPLPMQTTFYASNPKYLAINAHNSQNRQGTFLSRWIHKDEVFWVEPAHGANRPPIVSAGADQTVAEGATVQLNGTASVDKDGDSLTCTWRQVAGAPVVLSNIHSATPVFTAPSGLTGDESIAFELVVSDGLYISCPDAVTVIVHSAAVSPIIYTNISPLAASVTASSVYATSSVSNLIDQCIDGYPQDMTCEWVSNGERTGAWVQLTWSAPVMVGRVVLYDRINFDDQILQGILTFSDGTILNTSLLDNRGLGGDYVFEPRQITSLRYTASAVSDSTFNAGLSEIEVFEANLAPVAIASTLQPAAKEGEVVQLSGSGSSDPNGTPLTYSWVQTGGVQVQLSDSRAVDPTFTVPAVLAADTVFSFALTVNDGQLDSKPASIDVTVKVENLQEEPDPSPGPNSDPTQSPDSSSDPNPSGDSSGGGSSGCFIMSL